MGRSSIKLALLSGSVTQARWRASALAILMMAVGFVHLLALLLMLYAWPLADDYFRYACMLDNSFVDCLKIEWLKNSGRWFSTGLSFATANMISGEGSYR